MEGPAPLPYIPVVLTSTGQDESIRMIRTIPVGVQARPPRDELGRRVRLVETDSPKLWVPADHAFYDPEESSHWW